MLASLCGQAAFSLVKAQQLTKLVEDVGKEPSTATAAASNSTRSSTSAINRTEDSEDIVDDNIEAFQFKFSEINFVRNIGSGSYGEVFKARLRGMTVAVKRINARGLRAEHVDAFCSEASLMCQLRHRNCVRFIGAVAEPPELCIITEFCQHGALSDLLLQQTVEMDFKLKLKCCLDAARGMEYMHSCNPVILHRDLKSDNLLVTSDWTVKVADFGLSRFRSDKKTMSQVGTPMWMAPEVILGEKYTEKADVYSFGVILWEIMTRKEPYEDKEAMQIVLEVVNKGLRPKIPPHYFDCPLVPLMRDCWEEVCISTFIYFVSRDFFIELSFDDLVFNCRIRRSVPCSPSSAIV
jgi:serine/threonine protein kinase